MNRGMLVHGLHGGPAGIAVVVAMFAVRVLMRRNRGGRRGPPRGPWGM